MEAGSFPLTGVGDLPNVTVAFPGEHWSNRRASGAVDPGDAVVPQASANGDLYMRKAQAGDAITQLAIALRPVDHPDVNTGPSALGPNEIRNQQIAHGEYVHAYYSGAFKLTQVDPNRTYEVGQLIGWDADGARPAGRTGTGSWAPNANADIDSVFEVIEPPEEYGDNGEVVLTVRSLRGQF